MAPELVNLSTSTIYGSAVIDWLWERKSDLAGYLIVVPTAQSSRRLREGLAERGPVLAPKVVTTGVLMQTPGAANEAVEKLAWTEVLEEVADWSRFEAIFPESPAGGNRGWSLGVAKAFWDLRRSLQDNGMLIESVARHIGHLEKDRWHQLALLERSVEGALKKWGYRSRSSQLAAGDLMMPVGVKQVVVAGVLDLPPVLTRFLEVSDLSVSVLVPDERVDAWGRPGPDWRERVISWPENGSVTLTGDPAQQADLAVRLVSEANSESPEVGLGTGDEEVAPELVRSFGRAGWVIHDPGATLPSSLAGWLGCWKSYLQTEGVKEVIDLLSFEEGRFLIEGIRSRQVEALSVMLDSHLVRNLDDVARAKALIADELKTAGTESKERRLQFQLQTAEVAEAALAGFADLRRRFLREGFHQGMRSLLGRLNLDDGFDLEAWLAQTEDAARQVDRSSVLWIDLLLEEVGPVSEEVVEGRVLDVQGWLELLHERAPHLVVCGLNEGRVPGRAAPNPWLPESEREALGLPCEESRAARDAYLLNALLEMRRNQGRVDLIVGKTSQGGDVLMPSRLLLTASGETLARQVVRLFAEVEPADSGVAWHLEDRWKWRPRIQEAGERMSVTAFSKYLACPFRYYLQRVLKMNQPDPERVEWNQRDFGNILHRVLEEWGRNPAIRGSADAGEIETFTLSALESLVERQFGKELPLAVALQVESLRLRLGWFAQRQAEIRADGWRITDVEKDIFLEIDGMKVTGQIDRIERHEDGRIRVLDYKSSKEAKEVDREHLARFRGGVPVHLQAEDLVAPDGRIWSNLQVPFYAAAFGEVDEIGYFAIGHDEKNVKVMPWEDFGEEEKESAVRCAQWVVNQVRKGVFWPPAERVTYEDVGDLTYGRDLTESFIWAGGVA